MRACVRFNTTCKTFTKPLSLLSKLQCKKLSSTNRGRHLPPTLCFSVFLFLPLQNVFLHHKKNPHISYLEYKFKFVKTQYNSQLL